MKLKTLLYTVLLLSSCQLFAQQTEEIKRPTQKGTFLIGAGSNLNFLSQKQEIVDGPFGDEELSKTNTFSFSSRAGYFIIDDLALGLQLRYDHRKIEFSRSSTGSKNSSILVQPFARYYFLDNKIRPFVYTSAGIGSSTFDEDNFGQEKNSLFGYEAGVGAAFFLTQSFSIDFSLGYNSLVSRDREEEGDRRFVTSGISSALSFSIYL